MPDAKSIFLDALALPPADRPAAVAARCGDDADLLARVNALLAAHDRAAAGDHTGPFAEPSPPDASVGTVVAGRYKLLERIGEGGMGSVWTAQQTEPVRRTVAVKLIKAGMDSKAVLARFEAERQALALMDHPNIARVLDGGLHAGRPFFVMELVKGVPVTDFCDARRLTPRARLELFVPVCQAVQHAHQKGVIHRDIKPSNVLVALYDDRPVPKVIDFGLAKATGPALTELTLHTAFGAVLGTPAYMSPEQASFNNLDVDTRSDVYSLGVLLYELLTGTTPVEKDSLARAAVLEVLRLVREQDAPRPSVRLSTTAALPSIAANRGTEPSRLGKLLRGELDWVVLKALEKDRGRRYESAAGFAADVQRYLDGSAVQAVPPTAGYRLRKFVRAHKGQVLAGGAVTTALVGGLAGTTWQAIRAEAEAERVRAEQTRTRDALATAERNQTAAERFLAQSFLRPLGYTNSVENYEAAEVYALDEMAQLSDLRLQPSNISGDARGDMVARAEGTEDRLKLLCISEALADPDTALRTARVAERFVQAVVGTSLERRQRAIEIVTVRQKDEATDPRVRLAACWFALALGANELPALQAACEYIHRTQQSDPGKLLLPLFRHPLTAEQSVLVAERLAAELMASTGYYRPSVLNVINQSLDNAGRGRLATALLDQLDRAASDAQREVMTCALGELCDQPDRLQGELIDRMLDAFADAAIRTNGKHNTTNVLVRLASFRAPRLDSKTAERVALGLVAYARLYSSVREEVISAIRATAGQLRADMRARLAAEQVATADQATSDSGHYNANMLENAVDILTAIGPERIPAVVATGTTKALAALAGRPDHSTMTAAWTYLAVAARWLDPAGRRSIAVASVADDRLFKTTRQIFTVNPFDRAIVAIQYVVADLDADTRRRLADRLAECVADDNSANSALYVLAKIDQPAARRLLTKYASNILSRYDMESTFRQLCGPVVRMEPGASVEIDRVALAVESVAVSNADYDVSVRAFHVLQAINPDREKNVYPQLIARMRTDVQSRGWRNSHFAILRDGFPVLAPAEISACADMYAATIRADPDRLYREQPQTTLRFAQVLAPRLDPDAAAHLAELWPIVLSKEFELNPGRQAEAIDAALSLAAVAPQATADRLRTAIGDRLIGMLGRAITSDAHFAFRDALRRIDPARYAAVRDAETRRGIHLLFDTYTPNDRLTAPPETTAVLAGVSDWRFLAAFLSHPRCVEPLRRPLLDRLDELLVCPRQTPAVAAAFALSAGGPLAVGLDAVAWDRGRVFRTQWDAAEYIARHHPDFPLGRPPRPTPRQ